jgi:hypothetical protein
MHQATGNARLLQTAAGRDVVIFRQGNPQSSTNVNGWNDGKSIYLVPRSFSSDNWLKQVAFHEFAHYWDDTSENSSVDTFRNISGWRQLPPKLSRWSSGIPYASAQDNWWYISSSGFARDDYGQGNPLEDIATSFAAYFMDIDGRAYDGNGAQAIPEKITYMNRFFTNLA